MIHPIDIISILNFPPNPTPPSKNRKYCQSTKGAKHATLTPRYIATPIGLSKKEDSLVPIIKTSKHARSLSKPLGWKISPRRDFKVNPGVRLFTQRDTLCSSSSSSWHLEESAHATEKLALALHNPAPDARKTERVEFPGIYIYRGGRVYIPIYESEWEGRRR